MRILIVNQSFRPDIVSVAQHAGDLASSLVDQGHEVTVLTARTAYGAPGRRFAQHEMWRGCSVRRVSGLGLGKSGKWRRILDSGALWLAFLIEMIRLSPFDVTIAMTHPPLIGVAAAAVTRLKGGRLISWVMDLNPDQAIAAGWIRSGSLAARSLDALLRFSLSASNAVVVLDRFMKRRMEKKAVPPSKMTVVPPWSHDDEVAYDEVGRASFRRRHGLDGKFVVMFSGNLSLVHPAGTLLEAAAQLVDRPDIVFCFVGGGEGIAQARAFAEQFNIRNFVYLPYQPLSALGGTLSAADLHVVLMGERMVGIVHPCKIYNILTVGKPFLHIGPDENHITDIIAGLSVPGIAYHVPHGDVNGAATAILDAAERGLGSVQELRRAGSQFRQAAHLARLISVIENAVSDECGESDAVWSEQKQ